MMHPILAFHGRLGHDGQIIVALLVIALFALIMASWPAKTENK